ncbi:SxtJ family membrane protein [uncultured Helicobacter sp.]|uniref:SxtJ family membrane protein n=1 Tax=uncultured Helicobacter sp. TaxID=175537 RepID=UPI00374E62DA
MMNPHDTKPTISTKDLRLFLTIWAGIFAIIAPLPLLRAHEIRVWALIACGTSLALLAFPRVIAPIYRLWIVLGEGIGFVISRSILAILFFGIFTPVALGFRLVGRDVLRQKPDKNAQSYFIERAQQPHSMKNQF